MDKTLRNPLRVAVTQCRKLLEESVADVLQSQFGIHRSGTVEDVSRLGQPTAEDLAYREQLLAHLRHVEAAGFKSPDAVAQLVREVAFTHLNRLCAFKLMEHPERKLIREAVGRGLNSNGFLFYLNDHPDDEQRWSGGQQDIAYRHFLLWRGEQLADEISALFAPSDPANRLFPKQKVLDQVLVLLNGEELRPVWSEDETIGWVYQYFTPKELRDQARKESAAPRNSYELAFRNQFFTPRYVVQFLTDNSLGRIWYEMLQGDTILAERCAYLARRPNEIFLTQGAHAPKTTDTEDNLSQAELLRQPVYVSYRERKDPRDLRVLDPACGSGHFLLYAFDLLQTIYEEAWHRPAGAPAWTGSGRPLHVDYPTLPVLRRALPSLILRHNLYGIDIDLRATQIAALALWLRAQRAYQEQGFKTDDRPPITRVNVVCAEPMPGEKTMLDEFVAGIEPTVLGQLVRVVFEKLRQAGEAGSLLKIEEELHEAIETAKRQWKTRPRHEQMTLFPEERRAVAEQMTIYDVAQITDEAFWGEAKGRVLDALLDYAERAANGQGYRRRLFTDDAARGFAFIDVCQRRYDIVLMNPPFGAASKGWKAAFEKAYPRTKNDLYAAFVERGLGWLCDHGILGAITSRTGFFLTSFQKWREELLLKNARPTVVADLGYGVLDTAMVETAAYCLGAGSSDTSIFLRLLAHDDKAAALSVTLNAFHNHCTHADLYSVDPSSFKQIPGSPFAYWAGENSRKLFTNLLSFENRNRRACITNPAGDDQRFFRSFTEVSTNQIGRSIRWVPITRGGKYSPYYTDISQLVDWDDRGRTYRGFTGTVHRPLKKPASLEHFFKPGITWPLRGVRFSAQALPEGCIFSVAGKFATSDDVKELPILLGIMNSRLFDFLIGFFAGKVGGVQYEVGVINKIPMPNLMELPAKKLGEFALRSCSIKRDLDRANETSHVFHLPALLQVLGDTLATRVMAWTARIAESEAQLAAHQHEIDDIAFKLYGIEGEDRRTIEAGMGGQIVAAEDEEDASETEDEAEADAAPDAPGLAAALLSYLVGCAFGRFDVRYATGELPTPVLPDPFAPLPVCSPGMLTGDDGLPLRTAPESYPLPLDADGILVDDLDHPDDLVRRVRMALDVIFGDRAEAIEREACQILGVADLREYLRRPGAGGFWLDHIRRYSKSRRKAPIYWLLQSPKKHYALWLSYHRLDKDILFKALVSYVEPKIRHEEERLTALKASRQSAPSPRELRQIEREIERQEALISDVQDFRDRLERAARRYLTPDLNDGVVLNIAPLWELTPWKEARQYWDELVAGKYEWSSIGQQLRQKGSVK